MKQLSKQEQALLDTAHQVLAESQRLMLPHHQAMIGPRLETFDEIQIHDVNVTGIRMGRYRTNILLLTHAGQKATVTRAMSTQDTVIVDLSGQQADIDQMRRFLLTTEECRRWHHAPWIVINMLKKRMP